MSQIIPRVTNRLSEPHGSSIHTRRPFSKKWPEPRRIMFIYIRVNRNQTLVIDQYVYDMPDGQTVDEAEEYLLFNARPKLRRKDPKRRVSGFDRVSFGWQPCCVTMVIDDAYWKFHPWPENPFEETVIFRKDKLLIKDGKPVEYRFEPNHSFFNFERRLIDGRQSIRFVNFMRKDAEGTSIGPRQRGDSPPMWEYCMDVYIRMPYNFSKRRDGEPKQWLTLVFDPPQDNGGSGGPPP